MNEIESLIQRAKRALASAELLIREGDLEGAVSRSYYAMFYAAEAILLTKNLNPSSHKGVITLFGEHFVKAGIFPKEMSKRFKNSFDRRLVGDYSFTFEVNYSQLTQGASPGLNPRRLVPSLKILRDALRSLSRTI